MRAYTQHLNPAPDGEALVPRGVHVGGRSMSDAKRSCLVAQLGTVTFDAAFDLQNRLLEQRLAGQIEDILLLLEHPPTITVGKSGKLENILAANPELSTQGIAVFCTDRGGDVTYHGPGQLVG